MKKRRDGLYMVNGPLIPGIMTFTLPLMLTSILQLLYNAADIIVVGRYVGSQALAAVGATASLINLLITGIFQACRWRTSVAVANAYGAQAHDEVSEAYRAYLGCPEPDLKRVRVRAGSAGLPAAAGDDGHAGGRDRPVRGVHAHLLYRRAGQPPVQLRLGHPARGGGHSGVRWSF